MATQPSEYLGINTLLVASAARVIIAQSSSPLSSGGQDIIVHECTIGFPVSILEEHLGMYYDIFPMRIGPQDLGWPVRRKRSYTVMLRRADPQPRLTPPHSQSSVFGVVLIA